MFVERVEKRSKLPRPVVISFTLDIPEAGARNQTLFAMVQYAKLFCLQNLEKRVYYSQFCLVVLVFNKLIS